AYSLAPADKAVIGAAASDRHVQIRAVEHAHGRGAGLVCPRVQHAGQALPQALGLEDPAIEEHRGRLRYLFLAAFAGGTLREHFGVAVNERRQVLGDCRIRRVRQTQLLKANRLLPPGLGVGGALREKALFQNPLQLAARELALERAADDLAAASKHRYRSDGQFAIAE